MLIQRRPDSLWLIKQHDHAWLSGQLAALWCRPGGGRLHHDLIAATGMHDWPWQEADCSPRFDQREGVPLDFLSIPLEERLPIYTEGLDRLMQVHPYVAMMVSLHYTAFAGLLGFEAFQQAEEVRRQQLLPLLTPLQRDEARLQLDLAYVQFFDLLSLYLCLTAPGSLPKSRPPWLWPGDRAMIPERREELSLKWVTDDQLSLSPFPFVEQVTCSIPISSLPQTSFDDEEEWRALWERSVQQWWEVTLIPGP